MPISTLISLIPQTDVTLRPTIDTECLQIANCLANFAFYCGTGYKTTMGMGQTRRVD